MQDRMSEETELAGNYRKHAKALRAAATFDSDAKTSLILKRIARDYDQMAQALEGVAGAGDGSHRLGRQE
jgi:hypothetical protein